MEFFNDTDLEARLFRSCFDETGEVMTGLLVARGTYAISPRGLALVGDTPVPVLKEPAPTEWGDMPHDCVLTKRGVDVLAFGNAYPKGGKVARQATVRLQVDTWARQLWVFGERTWVRRAGRLVKGEPEPFERVPLTWQQAYGGAARRGKGTVAHPDNPLGKGFYLEEDEAEGGPLANIEDPESPIEQWSDQPRPLCPGPLPLDSRMYAENFVETDEDGEVRQREPAFNCAHPKWRVEALNAGQQVRLTGMTPGEPLAFAVPGDALAVDVALEGRKYSFRAVLDTVYFLPEERRVALTWRCHFTYRYVREELRVTRLRRVDADRPA